MPQNSTPKKDPMPTKDPKVPPADPELQNEGEGSRTATRRYDAAAERAAANPKRVDELAKKAEKALEGSEGEELRKAEELAKKRGQGH